MRDYFFQEAGRYGNCVFVSRDENGNPVYGVKRSADPVRKFVVDVEVKATTAEDSSFLANWMTMQEMSIILQKKMDSSFVTEAVIDLMSLQSLYLRKRDHELRQAGELDCKETDYKNRFLTHTGTRSTAVENMTDF